MSFIRRASSRTLIALSGALIALVALGAVVATGAGSGSGAPPQKPLAQAVADSLAGPQIEGLTARVTFTNKMLASVGIAEGGDPLIGGGSGRLWASADGDLRIELQSDHGGGDAQIVASGDQLWIYHAAANTVYRATMPAEKAHPKGSEKWPPSVVAIRRVLRQLGTEATVSGAVPGTIAGRAAYSTRIEPKGSGGLIGGADVTWDAANGAPLRVAIFARGATEPTLALAASEISFGAVDSTVFAVQPPPSAKVEELNPANAAARKQAGHKPTKPIRGLAAAQAGAPFTVSAPAELAGRKRIEVMLVGKGKRKSVIISYGTGLGAITVIESAASGNAQLPAIASSKVHGRDAIKIPTVRVGSANATVLATPLGSIASFTRDGVRYVVIGSVTQQDALAAARAL